MGVSVNGSEGLGGHGEGFEQQNDGQVRRNPGEGPKVNGGSNSNRPVHEFMGVRDSDVLDSQDPFRECRMSHNSDGINERGESELQKQSEKEKEEHPWASMKIARRIARDHMKENKMTLKEFFNIREAVYKKGPNKKWVDDKGQVVLDPHPWGVPAVSDGETLWTGDDVESAPSTKELRAQIAQTFKDRKPLDMDDDQSREDYGIPARWRGGDGG